MKKHISNILILSIFLASCARKQSINLIQEHPGYYQQWFNEHKNEKGEIPTGMNELWYAFDRQQIAQERGGNSVISRTTSLANKELHGGRTRAILVSSLDSNRVFVGSVSGGLWRSEDGGNTWSAVNDQNANLSVTAIVENPFNPKEIYYGTGEVRGASVPPGNGIYKSEDGGLTFKQLTATKNISFTNYMAHSVVDSQTVWVGSSTGLWVTRNSGETWKKVTVGTTANGSISGVISFPDSSMMVSIIGNGRIFKSPKGDLSPFTAVNDSSLFPKSGIGRVLIANCRKFPNTVYAFHTFNEYQQKAFAGFFKSTDGGNTWIKPSSEGTDVGSAYQMYCQMLGVHPTNPNYVMIGAVNAKFSRNGGINWTGFDSGHADNHIAIPSGSNSNDVFVGNDGGIYKGTWFTLQNGVTNKSRGYTSSQYYAGNYGPSGQTCMGGTQDNGTWRYTNGVLAKYYGADGGYAHISQQNGNVYFSTQNGNTLYRPSISNTNNTVNITPPIVSATTNKESVDFINQFEMNYTDSKQLYYRTGSALWRSIDKGVSWERLNKKVFSNITAVGVTNELDPTVYVGGSGTFYKITNAATRPDSSDFVNYSSKLPQAMRNTAWGTITVHPFENTTLFVGISSMTANARIFKGVNVNTDTMQWKDLTGNLPAAMSVYQIQPHPDAPDSVLLAATAFGLYYTTDNGKTWTKETRIPNVAIFEMKLRASDKNLFLFTHGRGVWHIELADLKSVVSSKEINPIAYKIYPNPVSEVLTIDSEAEVSSAQVFDLTGKEVLQFSNTNQINVSQLSNGVYLLKIYDTKGKFSVQKFVKE